ncbi:hypothetical protein VP01_286g5 [Puccinia sorghi]|uniref:Uncharacterized protein n=1 Tax=Puccinia sorghi TaxID=27349 RepID=A0A0L6V1V2_9BASI|nr:hypothetical protein VP01_286g5 [Puccinia sorghi]
MASQEHETSKREQVVKGILGAQIMAVPVACALTSLAVVLAARFLSKTATTTRPVSRRYLDYQSTVGATNYSTTRPACILLARFGALLVASVSIAMSFMELTIVYQTAVTRPAAEATYQHVVPWTSSLVPLLSSIVSIASQSYFSNRILHYVQRPRLFFPFLVIMGMGSLSIGTAATVALLIEPFHGPTLKGVSVSEGLFWAYLLITTLSSFVISVVLIGSYLKDRRATIMEARRSGQVVESTKMASFLRFFLSTYTLVFIFDLMCLITSIVSSSRNFEVAFNASKAFLVVQKLMVRVMAVSYLYALVDGLPKSPIFLSPTHQPHFQAVYALSPASEPVFLPPKSQPSHSSAKPPSNNNQADKLKSLQTSVSRTLDKYEAEKLKASSQDATLFSYAYPPASVGSNISAKSTKTVDCFPYSQG